MLPRRKNGFVEIVVVSLAAILLTVGTISMIQFTRQRVQARVLALNKNESFYSLELLAIRNFIKNSGVASPTCGSDTQLASGKCAPTFPNQSGAGVTGTATGYASASYQAGEPVNFLRTKGFDPGTTVIRRYSSDTHVYKLPTAGNYCSTVEYPGTSATYQLCLSSGGAPPVTPGGPMTAIARGFFGTVYSLAVATDGSGKIYAAGDFTSYRGVPRNRVARINADGTLDTTFVPPGTGFNQRAEAIAVAGDGTGKVYVGGLFTNFNGTAVNRFARLNTDGTLDATFAGAGFDGEVFALASATDGSGDIYVGGSFTAYAGTARRNIARINSNGTIDAGFAVGTGFTGTVPGPMTISRVYALVIATDGTNRVYAGGYFNSYNGTARNHIARIQPSGAIDATFNPGTGFSATGYLPNQTLLVQSLAITNDGTNRIYAGGQFTSYNGNASRLIARILPTGAFDATFVTGTGLNGISSVNDAVNGIAVTTDGMNRVYAVGEFTSYQGVAASRLIRLNADGTRDASFPTGSGLNNYGVEASVFTVVSANDGTHAVYVGGDHTSYHGQGSNRLSRIELDGTLHTGFSGARASVGPKCSWSPYVTQIEPLDDGSNRVYLAGYIWSYNGTPTYNLVRINYDGSLDPSYNFGTSFGPAASAGAFKLLELPDGSGDIYVGGGFTIYQGLSANRIIRLKADGSRDTSFIVGTGFNNGIVGTVTGLAFEPNGSGKIYASGTISNYNGTAVGGIARISPNGALDTAFNTGSGFNMPPTTISTLTDGTGRLYVGGIFTSVNGVAANRIVRLNPDGSRDSSFAMGTGFDAAVTSIARIQGSTDIYVAGQFANYKGTPAPRLVRLKQDGALDPSFAVGAGFNLSVNAIALLNDGSGKLLVAGAFTTYQGLTRNGLVRLNSNGSLDASFNIGTGFQCHIMGLAWDVGGTGKLYVGGSAPTYNGMAIDGIVRLNPDGTVD